MNSIFYSIITLLLLTGGVLFLMHEFNKQRSAEASNPVNQADPCPKRRAKIIFRRS